MLPATLTLALERPEIPSLDLSRADPMVRDQLTARRGELEALLDREPTAVGTAEALSSMGRLYLAYDYLLAGVACHEAARERRPDSFADSYLLGYAYDRLGKPDESIAAYERGVELDPENPAALLRLANHLLAQRRLERAEALFERAYRADGSCVGALYGSGEVARQSRDDETAVRLFTKALEQSPQAAQIRYALGRTLHRMGRTDEARAHLEQADWRQVSLGGWLGCADPLVVELADLTTGAPAHLLRGGLATFRGLPEVEISEFRKAVAANPQDSRARANLGTALYRQQDLEAAAEQYREAVRLAPRVAFYRQDLGQILEQLGRHAEALELFRSAVEINPAFKEAHVKLAEIFLQNGRFAEVAEHCRTVIAIDPLHRQARILLVLALMRQGDRQGAMTELGRSLDDYPPQDLAERLQLATMLATLGDPGRALGHFSAVAESAVETPTRALAHTRIGQTLMMRGDLEGAKASLQTALELAPELAEAQAALARILAASGGG
ncbi:MAG: tetratricopeptide repeat protein [Thermoanaerobaculia bacterium]